MNLKAFVLAACASSVFLSGYISSSHSSLKPALAGHMPVEISMTQGTIGGGNQVTYRVVLAGYPDFDQEVEIATSDPSAYVDLPETVVVMEGTNQVSFNVTLSQSLPSYWYIGAAAEGGVAMSPVQMQAKTRN